MDGIDKMLQAFDDSRGKSKEKYIVTTMTSSTTCNNGNMPLDEDDLLIPDYIKNGYIKGTYIRVINGTLETDYEQVKPLQKGDQVVLAKVSDDKYLILGRTVIS